MSAPGGSERGRADGADSATPCETNDIEQAQDFANRALVHHFGSSAHELTHETSGASNLVFSASHADGAFVVRLCADDERLRAYEKERWVTERARAAGIPTPEILAIGHGEVGCPYMIMSRVAGDEATAHPRRTEILRDLGALGALINTIPTSGFGDVFDWAPPALPRRKSWQEFLDEELRIGEKLETLARNDMLPPEHLSQIRRTLEALSSEPRSPHLNHGDLRLKNVIVDAEGTIVALLDWEKCVSGLAPEWELSLALHDLSVDEKDEFVSGYGIEPEEVARLAPVLKAFNLLNYAPFIQEALDAGDDDRVARYRLRFEGSLDLYSM